MADTPTRPAPAPVYRVAPDVGRLALRLARGDRRRLDVTGTDTVMVRNDPRR